MQRVATFLLLLASLVPAVLSAAPRYHCRMTGLESFRCGCCPAEEGRGETGSAPARSCCAHGTPAAQSAPLPSSGAGITLPSSPGICLCCESRGEPFASELPRERSADELALRLVAAPLAPASTGADDLPAIPRPGAADLSRTLWAPCPPLALIARLRV